MAASKVSAIAGTPALGTSAAGPAQSDLDKCVHCGLCLNACPTYRELGVEMDSPRGRIYQMNQVAAGAPVTPAYIEHLDLCLACRGCETACPSGRIVAARSGGNGAVAIWKECNGTIVSARPGIRPSV